MNTKETGLLDLLLILAKYKKFILITTIVVSVIAVIYSLIVPIYWTSTATILPTSEGSSKLSFDDSSLLSMGSSFISGSFQSFGIDVITILESRTFSEKIIKKFDLINYFKIDDLDSLIVMEKAVNQLTENVRKIYINDDSGLISISITTKDKYLSMNIANFYCEMLEKYNIETRMSQGKRKRVFIEKRLKEIENEIEELTVKFRDFQNNNKTINIDIQTEQIIRLYSNVVAEKITNDIELEYSKKYLEKDSPIINKLIQKELAYEKKIRELELSDNNRSSYILSIDNIPELSLKYAKLMLEIEIKSKVYEFLYPQYESAKIEEVKDLPTLEIIDKAIPAGLRTSPKRAKLCIMTFIVSLIFSILFSFIFNSFSNLKNDEVSNHKLQILKKLLLNKD